MKHNAKEMSPLQISTTVISSDKFGAKKTEVEPKMVPNAKLLLTIAISRWLKVGEQTRTIDNHVGK